MTESRGGAFHEAATQLLEAAAAQKCWPCGCLHTSLTAIEGALREGEMPAELDAAINAAKGRLKAVRYDCLGCEVCYPALAVNALDGVVSNPDALIDTCPTERIEAREGWPPLPGDYTVLRYRAPVAICTLTDEQLSRHISAEALPAVSILGTMFTENLGIERVILNIVANPNIRFLILCGADSRQSIGHLPGQSFVALSKHGVDDRSRIIGAVGKRPILKNVEREMLEHFRRSVEVIDLVGRSDLSEISRVAEECAARNPGPATAYSAIISVKPVHGYLPDSATMDPAGYFVVHIDHRRECLVLEHYTNAGILDAIIEGGAPAELYYPAVERGLLTRLDHAAYLGRELARAESALATGQPFRQDAAPDSALSPTSTGCGCSTPGRAK